ncbi:MAG: EamA family transporter [Gammaproteobacteria bacterium]|nr:EamA family transporter [Gammaproteobacteria bacterium]MBU1555424.1 EamA family transporter [Gammaproteobacteria bacterium]MBU2070286.1 EamA family transporter [Gammaproteobacteria bacterium]MBU2185324.1 EamA family transporter [Gammaproteobacteria bacterium]MBU2203582.1 EamA family transporter [Gammaproteobacteria bacterium]
MSYLIAVTLLWAFSFSLIGVYLAGQVDAYFAVLLRVLLALLVFLPFMRRLPLALAVKLIALGAVQLGLMYLFYYQSFLLLTVPEVLIFTIFTPVYITLLYDVLQRRFNNRFLMAALLAVVAAAIMRFDGLTQDYWLGFVVVQAANLCFAMGQVGYKILLEQQPVKLAQHQLFGWFYLGAVIVALPAWWVLGGTQYPHNATQWTILLWLGLVASGGGYYCWNKGTTLVSSGMLAVMNNMLIPAGLVVNIVLWNRNENLLSLTTGSALLLLSCMLCKPVRNSVNPGVANGQTN